MDSGTISLSFSPQYYNKILKAYSLEKCRASTVPSNKKPIAAEALDKEQHSIYRTAVGQLLWVSQLRADIAFAVKELSRLKNLKQLLFLLHQGNNSLQVDPLA
eukprot:6491570-Amphidinium_carterae.3